MSSKPLYHDVLPNGLSLLLRESHLAAVAELQIWAQVGSADERPGEEGLAHFHEHMLFKGTEKRGVGEVASAIEGIGGRINAYTSYDTTVYHATVPAAGLDDAIDVLVDMVRRSTFDPDEITREIEVVLDEIRRSDDSPHSVCAEALFAAAYQVHPYRAPILGTRESVATFTRDRVQNFFRRWYAPDNLLVVACGDFEAPALAAKLARAFADAEPTGARRDRPVEPPQTAVRSLLLRRPFERATLELAWPAVGLAHPDTPHLDLLAFVLGEGESCRLVRRVKERDGAVDGIDCSCYTPLDAGMFGVVRRSRRRTRARRARRRSRARSTRCAARRWPPTSSTRRARTSWRASTSSARASRARRASSDPSRCWRATSRRSARISTRCARRPPRICCASRSATSLPSG